MSNNEDQQDSTPAERLTFALQSTEELTAALDAVSGAIKVAEATILGAKKRKEELAAELAIRKTEDHKKAMQTFACPKCGNTDLGQMTYGTPAGYDWASFGCKEDDYRSSTKLYLADSEADYTGRFFLLGEDGELEEVKGVGAVVCCQGCQHVWPFPKTLLTEWS